jgi:uncharacterized membrane protein YeaQ/YmgE (transglycosylase-associated protein family)
MVERDKFYIRGSIETSTEGILNMFIIDISRGFHAMTKLIIGLGSLFGSVLGSYIPSWWGQDSFSIAGILFSIAGGVVGILLGYQLAKRLGFG